MVRVPARATDEQLEEAYAKGLLRKEALEDGAHYHGFCRNTQYARWHAATAQFLYVRTKFGERFIEAIRHPVDDRNYDVFVATAQVEDVPDSARVSDESFEWWGQRRRPGTPKEEALKNRSS